MKMEECMIVCRLEVAEHGVLLDKIRLAENLATGDKNAVSIARATITIYVPPSAASESFNEQSPSSSPCQSPTLHTPATVQPAVEVNSYVQSGPRHTLPSAAVTAGSTGSTGGAALARRECGNSNGASVAHSHTRVDNNNNGDKLKDNRELLRKIAENYRILNRRDVPQRPANNYRIVSRREIQRIVHGHKAEDNVLPKNTKMATPNVNDENPVTSSKLSVAIDRARLGDRLNTLLDNGTLQPSTARHTINTEEHEETARNGSESSISSTDRSTASSSSLEQYLKKKYEKCRAKGECFDTYIMTRHQRELLQLQEDFAMMTEEEELPPAGHRKSSYRIKTRMSSKMKKKQALLATFAKGAHNGESVKVSPITPPPSSWSSVSSDSDSSSAPASRKRTSKYSECTAYSLLDTDSSSSSATDDPNETETVPSSANAAVDVRQKIRAVPSETLAQYLAHMNLKQRSSLDRCEATTNTKDEDTTTTTTTISAGDGGVSAGGELHGEPLVTADVGRTVVIQCSTQTLTNSASSGSVSVSASGSGSGETAAVPTVQCNSGSSETTRKTTRIQRIGRRFFRHNTIPYIKPRKRVQLRKTFSASLTHLVDKSIEISRHKDTSTMSNNGEPAVTSKLRNTRKAKTPKRKQVNSSQDGNSAQPIAEEDVYSAPDAGSSASPSADAVTYKGYSICNKLNVNSTQDNGHQRDTDNENNSPEYKVTQSDNTTFEIKYERGDIRQGTKTNNACSYEDEDSATSQQERTVEKDNVVINVSDDEAHNTDAQPARGPAQPATDMIIITNVRSMAGCSDDEVSSNASTVLLQPQASTGIGVKPEYLLQTHQPSDPQGNEPQHSNPAPPPSTNSTGRSEQNQVQPSNDDERLQYINRRLHNAHHAANNSAGPAKVKEPARPKRTYTRRQKQNTDTDEAVFQQYQQIQQHTQQQLSLYRGMHSQPAGAREMYELAPNGRNVIPIHQYQSRERMSVPVTSAPPPSYRSTVTNMINPNIPRLPMAARQSGNPALDLRRTTNIPILPVPPPPPYPSHITNPMIHSPIIPTSHVNPMLPAPPLPSNTGRATFRYPITIVPSSSQAAPRPSDDDIYRIRPMHVLENQHCTVTGPRPSEQPERQTSVQSPPKPVTQHTVQSLVHSAPQRQVQPGAVQSPVQREAQSTSNHTVESMLRSALVQSPRQVAGTRITVQAQVHPPPRQRAPTSTERVKVEHLTYSPIEDIVNKVVQSPAVPQDRLQSPAVPDDRVPSSASAQNVVEPVAEDTSKSPSECNKLVTLMQTPFGNKVVKLLHPVTQVGQTSEVKARQEPDVHSCTLLAALRAMASATHNEPDDENIENQQVTTGASEETLTASDSVTIRSVEVDNIEAGQSSTAFNTSAQQSENNNDVIPATTPHADTPRARPRIRNRPRGRRYWQTPSAVRFSRTARARRIVNRLNYNRRRIERSTAVISPQDTTTTKNCEVKIEQTTETSSVSNTKHVQSTSTDPCEHQTPDRMNVPVNFYSQTDEPPVYVSTVISQGIEALQLAQTYLDTFQNNHDTMRDLQQALRELIANVNTSTAVNGERTDTRVSHTEHLLKQFLRNQQNIRTEFVIRQEVVTSHKGTEQPDNPGAIFTVQRLQEALEKLAVLLTQLRDSAASEHAQQRTSEEQPSTEQRDTTHDEPVVNLQLPWSRAKNIVGDNSQPSTSREVPTVTTTLSPQDDVKYKYALGKLEERKLDNTKSTAQPSPAVNTREVKDIVTELLDNGVPIQLSIPARTPVPQRVKPDEENSNVTSDDTTANNIPEASSQPRVDIPPLLQTDTASHQSITSRTASGIVGPCCQICCSFAKHEEAKRNAQKTSTVSNNEQSTLVTGNPEQQQQPTASILTTANQHQPTTQRTEPILVTGNQQQPMSQTFITAKQQPLQEPTSGPTLITVNQQQPIGSKLIPVQQKQQPVPQSIGQQQPISQPIVKHRLISQPIGQQQPISHRIDQYRPLSQPIYRALITTNQQQSMSRPIEQQPMSQVIDPTLIDANQQQLAMVQSIVSSVSDAPAVSSYSSRPAQRTQHAQIPRAIDIASILGANASLLQPQPAMVVNGSQVPTATGQALLATENTSHQDGVSVIPSPSTHLPAIAERRSTGGECLLSSAAYKTEELQDARTPSSTSASQSNKRHVTDIPPTDDGSKRARLEPSTSDTITPASAQSVPATDFLAAVNQRLDNTESLIRTLINKKDRKRSTSAATAVRNEELASQSSATSLYSERTPSRSTLYTHRPPETQHYNPLSSHHQQRQRHHTPYNVPTYQSSEYSIQPQSYHAEHYVRQLGAATPLQQPARLPSRYVSLMLHPGPPLPASVPSHSLVQPSQYPIVEDEHPRRRSEPLSQYIPLSRRTNMDLPMSPSPPPPPSSRQLLNHHEYRSRRSSHRRNPSATSTVQPSAVQPNQDLFSEFINYIHRNNLNISNNGTDSTMYPVVQVPPFPAEVLQGKQYNSLLCKYYHEPCEHAPLKCTINYKSKPSKTKCCKQRTDYNNNNIVTSIGDKNTVIQAKRYPRDLVRKQQINNTQCNSDNNTKHAPSVAVAVKPNHKPPAARAKHAIELAGARLQVAQLNSFIENNRRMLLRHSEPHIRPETLSKYAVTNAREIHRLFDTVVLTDSVQYYRSLWCMWSVAENKHLFEFYRTVTQLQIRAGQTPFAIRIFIELLRCKYFRCVRKLAEDQCKR